MPRDWMRDERDYHRERWAERHGVRELWRREDFGQADFSGDYGYDADRREGYRAAEETGERREDYGQADYSTDYVFDPDRGEAYRRLPDDDRGYGRGPALGPYRDDRDQGAGERRSWLGRPMFGGRDGTVRRRVHVASYAVSNVPCRQGPSRLLQR